MCMFKANKKVMRKLMFINRFSDNIQKPTQITVVSSLVLSVMLWGKTNGILLYSAPKLQNFVANITVGGMGKCDHVSPAI